MISKRDNYILVINFFLISYLCFRYNVSNSFDYRYFDICIIHILLIMLCQLEFGYRYFVMTISKLSSYSNYSCLDYCYYEDSSGKISDIYVRVLSSDNLFHSNEYVNTDSSWYLLDRYLLFPTGLSKIEYESFILKNKYVCDLSKYMLDIYNSDCVSGSYNMMRANYRFKYYLMNLIVLISLLVSIIFV